MRISSNVGNSIVKYLESFIVPQNLIEMARGENFSLTDGEIKICMEKMTKLLQPGDIILVKTPNLFFDALRHVYNSDFDHTLVVVDNERCLHITYPKAKLVKTFQYMNVAREAIVIRPNLNALGPEQREQFIFNMKHASVGKIYNSRLVFSFFKKTLYSKVMTFALDLARGAKKILPSTEILKGIKSQSTIDGSKVIVLEAPPQAVPEVKNDGRLDQPEMHDTAKQIPGEIVCSDQIFKQLTLLNPQLKESVMTDEKGNLGELDFYSHDFVTPQDIFRIARAYTPEYFTVFSPHSIREIEDY
jgi:hypothetical protein